MTETYSWASPYVVTAVLVSLGAGLATAVGGLVVFAPSILKRLPPPVILSVSLAVSGGVMLYVSFIEIFAKAHEEILSVDPDNEGKAAAITTAMFFFGMLVCVLLEALVHWISERYAKKVPPTSSSTSQKEVDIEIASSDTLGQTSVATTGGGESTDEKNKAFFANMTETGHDHGLAGDEVDMNAPEARERLGRMGALTAVAIALHNFPEGLATFLATVSDPSLGASLGVAIAIHNVPEGICVAMPIYYATNSKWKAFGWSFLSGITEPIGGIVGFAALQAVFTPMVFGMVFSAVGGMMVFIVLHELLPAAHRYLPGRSSLVTSCLIFGMAVMSLSLVLFVA